MRSPTSPLLTWTTDSRAPVDFEVALRITQGLQRCADTVLASNPHQDKRLKQIFGLGASVGGPFAVNFAIWILRRAKNEGLEKIYFLARDGKCILEACSHLLRHLAVDTDLRYLLVARKAILELTKGPVDSPGMRYLATSGLGEQRKSAVVDLGWTGSLFKGLAESASRLGGTEPEFVCVGIEESEIDLSRFTITAFLADYRDPRTQRVPAGSVLEVICATDDGPVDGYEMTGDVAQPVLKPPERAMRDWGVSAFIEGRSAFIRAACADRELIHLVNEQCQLLPAIAAGQIDSLIRRPARVDSLLLGQFPHDKSVDHDSPAELAPRVRWGNIINHHVLHNSERLVPDSLWREASIARSSPLKRLLIRALGPHRRTATQP